MVSSLLFLTISIVSGFTYFSNIKRIENSLGEKALGIARTAAVTINGDNHRILSVNISGAAEMDEFQTLHKKLKNIKNSNLLQTDIYTYTRAWWVEDVDNIVFIGSSSNEPFSVKGQEMEAYMKEALTAGKDGFTEIIKTINGEWITGYSPILDDSGNVTGVVEVALATTGEVSEARNMFLKNMGISALIAMLLCCFFTFIFATKTTNPIVALGHVTRSMADGDLKTRARVSGSDEIAKLSKNFNQMAENLEKSYLELETYSKDLEKMVEARTAEVVAAEKDKQVAESAKKQAEQAKIVAENATKEAVESQEKMESALKEAKNEKMKAVEATVLAQKEREKSEMAAQSAKIAAEKALKAKNEAAKATRKAEDAAKRAEIEKAKSEEEKRRAEEAMLASEEAKVIAERSRLEAENAANTARLEKEKAKRAQLESEDAKAMAETLGRKAQEQSEFLMNRANLLLAAVSRAEEGDLTVEIEFEGSDPVAKIGRGLSNFIGVLRTSILSIENQANRLNENNIKLGGLTEEMFHNALTTANQIAGMVEASARLNENMKHVKNNTDEIKLSISNVANSTAKAANLTDEMVASSNTAKHVVDRLSDRVLDIQDIVSLINQIADQTNLLALNATIEASRAGDNGRGFSVVASEVKELAGQTAVATTEISNQVKEINTEASSTVKVMETISGFIERINDSSRNISESTEQQEIASSEIVGIISHSLEATSLINKNLFTVKQATDSTKSVTQSTKEAALSVKRVSDQLVDLVGKFKIHKEDESDSAA